MARVFISYRRSDGLYPVGWLAERLSQLDAVSDVRTAFQDAELRCGDDFPAALEDEIAACDVLVAVIGPGWHGRRDDGSTRLADISDWVGRELTAALSAGKRVLPVLVGGAEPLTRTDLPPGLGALADLHSVEFSSPGELDAVVADILSHLDEVDRERARLAGLDAPVDVPPARFGWPAVLAAVAAGGVGLVAGMALTQWGLGDADVWRDVDGRWVGSLSAAMGTWAAVGTLGYFYVWPRFSGELRIEWPRVAGGLVVVALLLAVQTAAFGISPPIHLGNTRVTITAVLAITLLLPWILVLLASAWTEPAVARHRLGDRVRLLVMTARAGLLAAAMVAVATLPAVVSAVTLNEAVADHATIVAPLGDGAVAAVADGGRRTDTQLIVYGIFLAALVAGALIWSRVQLRHQSAELRADVADLPPQHRHHAEVHLVDDIVPLRPWWVPVTLVAPIVTAVVATRMI